MTPSFIALAPEERTLLERARREFASGTLEEVTAALPGIVADRGIDVATAVLYLAVRRSAEHGSFIEQVESLPEVPEERSWPGATLVIVPGGFYRERPETGADGAFVIEQARMYGYRAELVPLISFGSLPENATILLNWLRQRREENLVLVSLSKSGAEVKLALADPAASEAFRGVRAWLNLSGILDGSPIVDWLFGRPVNAFLVRLLFCWKGYPFRALHEMRHGKGLDFPLSFPEHLQTIHLVGFPLHRHLTRPIARRGHRRLAALGPNDGGANLLADACRWPGLVYPVWGADHYLRPAWDIRRLMGRLFCFLRAPTQNGRTPATRQPAQEETP